MLNDFEGNPDPKVGGDKIRLQFVPLDLGSVGDLVVEVLEKAGHVTGLWSEATVRGAEVPCFFSFRKEFAGKLAAPARIT